MAVLASNKCQSHTAATVKPVGLYVHTFAEYFARLRAKVVTVYGICVGVAHAHCRETRVVCRVHCYVTVNGTVLVNSSFYGVNKIAHFVYVPKKGRYWLTRLGIKAFGIEN